MSRPASYLIYLAAMTFAVPILGLSLAHWLIVLSALLSVAGAGVYIRDTLRGTTKPNRVSFFLWSAAPLIATTAALNVHADLWATVRIFMSGFMPLLVFAVSFINPQSYWKLTKFDFLCGAFSVLALMVWGIADSARTAILFAAIADGFAAIPTLRKAWNYPETETGITYVTAFLAAVIVIPAIPEWNIENAAFQVYLLTANSLLLIAVYRKRIFQAV